MLITDAKCITDYYQALLNRSVDYVGLFYVGVKTTGIFCISTCRARKPKPENVEFYSDSKSALGAGFRPCKVCRPTENAGSAPVDMQNLIYLVQQNPEKRITDAQLKQRGMSPEQVRRWFVQNYGMTFQAYQRNLRMTVAVQELQYGHKVTDVAFDSGYESLSGFAYTYKKLTGKAPSDSSPIILMHRFTTPIGPMIVCATEKGLCLLEFSSRKILEKELTDLQRLLKAQIMIGENAHTRQVEAEITEYFSGQRRHFDVALDMPGTDFQRSVWQALLGVSYGSTASYQDQARKLGKLEAVRAVASANGANRISIIVPCHRIIGKDGSLVGYGGGLARKRWLLEHERRHSLQGSSSEGRLL